MRARTRKILAAIGGVMIVVVAIMWTDVSSPFVYFHLAIKAGVASEFRPGTAVYKKYGDLFTLMSFVGLAMAAGLTFTLMAWERRPPAWKLEVVFSIFLALVLPMSFINYWAADIFVSRSQQVVLNLVEAFLAAVCVLSLNRLQATSNSAIVLKSMASFFLLAFGFFVPLFFSIVWLLNWERIVSLASSDSVAPGWVSGISGIVALAVSIQQYRLAKAKQNEKPAGETPKIIVAR